MAPRCVRAVLLHHNCYEILAPGWFSGWEMILGCWHCIPPAQCTLRSKMTKMMMHGADVMTTCCSKYSCKTWQEEFDLDSQQPRHTGTLPCDLHRLWSSPTTPDSFQELSSPSVECLGMQRCLGGFEWHHGRTTFLSCLLRLSSSLFLGQQHALRKSGGGANVRLMNVNLSKGDLAAIFGESFMCVTTEAKSGTQCDDDDALCS